MCYHCNRTRCDQNTRPAKRSYCHHCNEKGQWSGSIICQGIQSKRSQSSKSKHKNHRAQTRYVNEAATTTEEESEVSSTDYSSDSSSEPAKTQYIKSHI